VTSLSLMRETYYFLEVHVVPVQTNGKWQIRVSVWICQTEEYWNILDPHWGLRERVGTDLYILWKLKENGVCVSKFCLQTIYVYTRLTRYYHFVQTFKFVCNYGYSTVHSTRARLRDFMDSCAITCSHTTLKSVLKMCLNEVLNVYQAS
jgi:hypothetical protein